MRAAVFGLIGAVLAVGGALANCPINRATLIAIDTNSKYVLNEPLKRPDLDKKIFRVSRYVNSTIMYTSPITGHPRTGGFEAYEIRGGGQTFLIKREYVHGSPALMISSSDQDDPKVGAVSWRRPTSRKMFEISKFGDEVNFGPLSALTLKIKSCR